MDQKSPFIIGIAGGTGSGKSTLARKIAGQIDRDNISIIDADSYYKDLSHISPEDRKKVNFDHPDAVDILLFEKHLRELKQGKSIEKNIYDFTINTRTGETITVNPTPLVIVEGIMILALKEVSRNFDFKIYLDEDIDVRLFRKIKRDIKERGRTIDVIEKQYTEDVKPMHERYVEPSKKTADIVLNHGYDLVKVIKIVTSLAK